MSRNGLNIYGDGKVVILRVQETTKGYASCCLSWPNIWKNKTNVLNKSKALLMMSEFEGLPMMALESMSFGVPIICNQNYGLNLEIQNGLVFSLLKKEDHLIARKHTRILSYSLSDAKKFIAHRKVLQLRQSNR